MRLKRLLFALLCGLLFISPVSAGQNVLDTDSFGGTNGTALSTYSANWPVFANWNNGLAILGSPGMGEQGGGVSGNRRLGQTWTNDHWCELTLDGTNLADVLFYIGVRLQNTSPAGDGYGAGWESDTNLYRIIKINANGTTSVLATSAHTRAAGDVVNFQAVGAIMTLVVTRGGSTLFTLSATDVAYTTGAPGIPRVWNSTSGRLAGSWRAGSVTADAACGGQPANTVLLCPGPRPTPGQPTIEMRP